MVTAMNNKIVSYKYIMVHRRGRKKIDVLETAEPSRKRQTAEKKRVASLLLAGHQMA